MWYLHCHERNADFYKDLLKRAGVKEEIRFFHNPFDLRSVLQKEAGEMNEMKGDVCSPLQNGATSEKEVHARSEAKVVLGGGTLFNLLDLCEVLSKDGVKNLILIKEDTLSHSFLEKAYRLGAATVLSAKDTAELFHLVGKGDEGKEKSFLSAQDGGKSVASFAVDTAGLESSYFKDEYLFGEDTLEEPEDIGSFIEGIGVSSSPIAEESLPLFDEEIAPPIDNELISSINVESRPQKDDGIVSSIEEEAPVPDLQYPHPLLAFCSVRGGVGKSAVSAMVALSAARAGMKVALVDFDLLFGNLFGLFGLAEPVDFTFYAQSKDEQKLLQAGIQVAKNLVLFGPCEQPEFAELLNASVTQLLSVLSSYYELVVIDTSTSWGDVSAQVAQTASKVCLMSDERCGAISSLGRGSELLFKLGIPRTNVIRLINRADVRNRDEDFFNRTHEELGSVPGSVPILKIYEGGVSVSEFFSAGDAVSLLDLENVFSESCKKITARLLHEVGVSPKGDEAKEFFAEKKKSGNILNFAQRTFLKDAS